MDAAGAKLLSKAGELSRHFASPQDQGGAHALQILAKISKTMMNPPPLGSSHSPLSRRHIVEDVDWDHWPFRGCHRERGLVLQTEVLSEPNDRGF
jgi:hypothetical protein